MTKFKLTFRNKIILNGYCYEIYRKVIKMTILPSFQYKNRKPKHYTPSIHKNNNSKKYGFVVKKSTNRLAQK